MPRSWSRAAVSDRSRGSGAAARRAAAARSIPGLRAAVSSAAFAPRCSASRWRTRRAASRSAGLCGSAAATAASIVPRRFRIDPGAAGVRRSTARRQSLERRRAPASDGRPGAAAPRSGYLDARGGPRRDRRRKRPGTARRPARPVAAAGHAQIRRHALRAAFEAVDDCPQQLHEVEHVGEPSGGPGATGGLLFAVMCHVGVRRRSARPRPQASIISRT